LGDIHLVITIPIYNESKTIGSVIKYIPKKVPHCKTSIVVIDDGSSDKAETAIPKNAIILRHKKNKGLGRAFDAGIKKALLLGADIIVNIDGDGQFNTKQIHNLISPIISEQADVVIGSRFISNTINQTTFIKKYGNKCLAKITSIITGQRFYDVTCGFRAYSREAALNLNIYDKFSYTLESIIDLFFKGFKIIEIPIDVRARSFGESKISGSISFYAIKSIVILIRNMRDNKPFHFFVLPGFISFILAIIGFAFLLVRFLRYNIISPYRSVLALSILLFAASIFLFGFGMLFDHLNKIKKNQDDILYYLKKGK